MVDDLRKYGFVPRNDEELATLSREDLDARLQDGIVFQYRN